MLGRLAFVVCTCLALVGCRSLPSFHPARPNRDVDDSSLGRRYQAGRLTILSNFVIPDSQRVLRELTAEGDDVCQTLGLPCSERPITVHLYRDAKSYGECLAQNFPNVPARRAFFLETNGQLEVYAHWSDRVAEDLRHEVAHGYLHAVANELPLWLDEGLAEFFEVPHGQGGLNPPHVDLLHDLAENNGWRPNLARLEHLNEISQMDQQGYAEAWSWVYFMLQTRPERHEILAQYLLDLSSPRGPAEPLSVQLKKVDADPEHALVAFLGEVNNDAIASRKPQSNR